MSFTIVYGDEAVNEIKTALADKRAYLSPNGGLRYPVTTDLTDWVLSFMSGND